MRTYDKEQAKDIAARNAIKAIASGYTAEQNPSNPKIWTVTSDKGRQYTVHLHINPQDRNEYLVFCDCPFSGNGFTNCTCKHGEICKEIADAEYYRDTNREIRETFRRIIQEETSEESSPEEGEGCDSTSGQRHNESAARVANLLETTLLFAPGGFYVCQTPKAHHQRTRYPDC